MLFATDRRDDNDEPQFRFANAPGQLSFGEAAFAIDPSRQMTAKAGSSLIQHLSILSEAEFRSRLSQALSAVSRKELLVYIHGYNNPFYQAALSAALLNDDINFDGVAMFYSWPSAGAIWDYDRDEDEIAAARDDFLRFLKVLKQTEGLRNIDIFAHSMGGRLPTLALDYINFSADRNWPSLSQVILAAPDIYTRIFHQNADAFRKIVHRTTIYASEFDTALMCSERLHVDRRVGQGGSDIFVEKGIDTIDVSGVEKPSGLSLKLLSSWLPCSWTGHAYYISNLSVQEDIHELITLDAEPPRRHGIIRKNGADYWVFKGVE
jgi:esterase/lipase superfamily enzyme